MRPKYYFRLRLVSLIFGVGLFVNNAWGEPLTVAQFLKLAPTSGEFTIKGYVAKHYRCPPCPPPNQCKPCLPNNILVSEKSESLTMYPQSGNYLLVFTEDPEQLELTRRYILTIKVVGGKTTGLGGEDVRLVEFHSDTD